MELSKMKQSRPIAPCGRLAFPLLAGLLMVADISANSVIAGGRVPEVHWVSVTPTPVPVDPGSAGAVEVAVIEIENNLPGFELILDFSDRFGGMDRISEVRLVALDGLLGLGLEEPSLSTLSPGGVPGRFVWRAGRQRTATLGYRMKVMVTFATSSPERPTMLVGMPITY
jgi:hypothetical protein